MGVLLLIMVGVYSVFVNEGYKIEMYLIIKIVDLIGVIVVDNIKVKKE